MDEHTPPTAESVTDQVTETLPDASALLEAPGKADTPVHGVGRDEGSAQPLSVAHPLSVSIPSRSTDPGGGIQRRPRPAATTLRYISAMASATALIS
jgi:hypothetical protein